MVKKFYVSILVRDWAELPTVPYLKGLTNEEKAQVTVREQKIGVFEYTIPANLLPKLYQEIPDTTYLKGPREALPAQTILSLHLRTVGVPSGFGEVVNVSELPTEEPDEEPDRPEDDETEDLFYD